MPTIPLLLEVRPSLDLQGTTVFLAKGTWGIIHDIKDSEIDIMLIPSVPIKADELYPINANKKELVLLEDARVKAIFRRAGTEKHVSVYANKVA